MQTAPPARNEWRPRSARIKPLPCLPVFMTLSGKRAMVAGGSDAAAWKAELLAAAGAEVTVYAPVDGRSADLSAMAQTHALPGGIVLVDRAWQIEDLKDAAIAVADLDDPAEAQRFATAARARGVAYNVVDKPAFCQIQFGAIVNRAPLVVSISTGGAAPILAQAMRRRIEAALPNSIGAWVGLAQGLRAAVGKMLPSGAARRTFWEALSARALAGDAITDFAFSTAVEEASRGPARGGRVTLVGAGPGDPELLTLAALRALQSADRIFFNEAVTDGVLELARREAIRHSIGSRRHSDLYQDGGRLQALTAAAQAGQHVVVIEPGEGSMSSPKVKWMAKQLGPGISLAVAPGLALGRSPRASRSFRPASPMRAEATSEPLHSVAPEPFPDR